MQNRLISRVIVWCVGLAACTSVVVGAAGVSQAATHPARPVAKTATVKIQGFLYKPKTLKIQVGTKVTWTNFDSSGHTVTSDSPGTELASKAMGTGKTYTHKFLTPGTFKYHCTFHLDMIAKVIVSS
jgi:plastocyanin